MTEDDMDDEDIDMDDEDIDLGPEDGEDDAIDEFNYKDV